MPLPGGVAFDNCLSRIDSSLGLPAVCPLQPHFTQIPQCCDTGMAEQLDECSRVVLDSPLIWHNITGSPRICLYMGCAAFNSVQFWKQLKALRNVHLFSFKFNFLFSFSLFVSRTLHEGQFCCVPQAGFQLVIHPLGSCDCQVSPFQETWGHTAAGDGWQHEPGTHSQPGFSYI